MKRIFLTLMVLTFWGCAADPGPLERTSPAGDKVHPGILRRGHSHNDYTRRRPLHDALDLRFGSVEADVFLVEGLLVAHDRKGCRPDRTLAGMYLSPLIARARENGGGIYPGVPEPLILLVDLKTDGEAAYGVLHEMLAAAPDVFTEFDRGVVYPRAVTVIVSGDTPREMIAGQARRFAFVDGRAADLEGDAERAAGPGVIPLVSIAWSSQFKWHGLGEMPTPEKERLRRLVGEAHRRGYKIRFWGVPNLEHLWREVHAAGVDLVNVDDLARAATVLRELSEDGAE